MTAGRNSFVAELVTLAGGRNLGDELTQDYVTVSTEWLLQRDPDLIICLYPGALRTQYAATNKKLGWAALRAVQAGRVYSDFTIDTILRPGPRVLDGIEQLRQVIATAPPATTNTLVRPMVGEEDQVYTLRGGRQHAQGGRITSLPLSRIE